MLAAVLHDVHDFRLEEVADPVARPGEVVIAIAYNGLCGSDPKLFERGCALACLGARGQAVIVAGSSKYPLQTSAHLLQHTEISITGSVAFAPAASTR
jgi:hypothetical protein